MKANHGKRRVKKSYLNAKALADAKAADEESMPKRRRYRRKKVPTIIQRFGRYLNRKRLEQKLSIRDFANLLGCPHSNVFQYEQLRKDPKLTDLQKMAHALGEPLPVFLERVLAPDESEARTPVSIV